MNSTADAPRWRSTLTRVVENFSAHHISTIAGGVAFFVILAIFPALAALISLYGLVINPHRIVAQINGLSTVMPSGVVDLLKQETTRLASRKAGLGIGLVVGLAGSLWSANSGVKSLFDALNVVYGEEEKRSFLRLNLISFAFTVGFIFFVLIASAALLVFPSMMGALSLRAQMALIIRYGVWPVFYVVAGAVIALAYRFGPSRQAADRHWITTGSAVAALAWLAVSALFSWYTANFANYGATYGSLGAIVGFMMWVWLSSMVVLLGAEIDAVRCR